MASVTITTDGPRDPDLTRDSTAHPRDSGQPSGGQSAEGQDPRRWLALGVCLAGVFMTLLDVSIVNVALPSLESGLKASASDLQWVLSGYAVTFGLALVPSGRLGDAKSRRTVFLVGLTGFVLASLACGLATTPLFLIVARLIQGLFAGVVTPQVTGIIQDLFRGPERGRAFGLFGAIAGISTAVGPLLGGALIALFGNEHGWRYVFFVNIPIGAVVIPVSARLLAKSTKPATGGRTQLDPLGSLLLGAGVVSILLPLVEQREWSGSVRYPLYGLAAVFLVAFVLWERGVLRRGSQPVIDLRLFRLETYSFGSAIAAIYFAGFTSIFFVLTVYLQQGIGYAAWQAGLTITAFAVAGIPSSRLSGQRSTTHALAFVRVGAALFAVGLVGAIIAVRTHGGPDIGWWLIAPLFVAGFGNGLVLPSNQTRAVSEVPVAQASAAGGAYQTFQRVGTAIGIAVVGTIFFNRLASSRGDYDSALERGIAVSAGFAVLTVVLALVEVLFHRRAGSPAPATPSAPGRRSEPAGQPAVAARPAAIAARPAATGAQPAPAVARPAAPAPAPGHAPVMPRHVPDPAPLVPPRPDAPHGRHNAQHPEDVGVH